MTNADLISPSSNGRNHSFFCSSVPYFASTFFDEVRASNSMEHISYLHVPRIWGTAIHGFRCYPASSHRLAHQTVFDVCEARTALVVRM